MTEEYEFIKRESESGDEVYEYRETNSHKPNKWRALKAKIIFWSFVLGGIAIGTLLFLFFMAFFIYFILPILAIYILWQLFKSPRRKF